MTGSSIAHKTGINYILVGFLCVYVTLLPIGTGLAGIIGSISLMNYIAAAIILVGILILLYNSKIVLSYYALPT